MSTSEHAAATKPRPAVVVQADYLIFLLRPADSAGAAAWVNALNAGATHSINTSREPLHERLLELTGGRGPDVIIEAIGLPQTFRSAVDEVAFTGRVV